ncbi:hypothetical protein AB1Y20_020711 [Prymnesium parvum]|uniref:CST complex subunit Stn1 N-terminal domain-containing protein n=1 Tax=Prymnesium parvum TaxID=97485 RepID=A0AB34JY03_PRYPA
MYPCPSDEDRPPPHLWGLSTLASADVKLLAAHLERLADASPNGDWLWLFNHPIRTVDVMGLVISVHPPRLRTDGGTLSRFTLDDGTGLVECTSWLAAVPPPPLGALARVLGRPCRHAGRRELRAELIALQADPMAECLHWRRAEQLWTQVYAAAPRLAAPPPPPPLAAASPPDVSAAAAAAAAAAGGAPFDRAAVVAAAAGGLRAVPPAELVERSELYLVDERGGRRFYRLTSSDHAGAAVTSTKEGQRASCTPNRKRRSSEEPV